MSDLLERDTRITRRPDAGHAPPIQPPPIELVPLPWPRLAKVLIAILAVTTLVGGVGMVVAYHAGEDDQERADQTQIDDLTAQRDSLLAEQQRLTDQLAAETGRVAILDAELGSVTKALATESANVQALTAERDRLQSNIEAATATIFGYESDLAASAEQLAALTGLFPVRASTRLAIADVVGTWKVDWVQAYCQGFTTCTPSPGFTTMQVVEAADHTLTVVVDGHFTAGMARADGALVAIAQSTKAVPACGGVARVANVSMVIYGRGTTTSDDGTTEIDGLGAVVVVAAPATATCPAGMEAFGALLTTG